MQNTLRPSGYGLLQVSGPDAKKFLQGQLTCNLDEVDSSHSRLGAHCNPQGRVLFLFRLFYLENAYYFVLPHTMVTEALGYLRKYAVFFKVKLHDASADNTAEVKAIAATEWAYFDVRHSRPQIYPATSGKFLPHDLNLHKLGGISWEKGCYTGQEIIARMQYRGKPKTQLYRARVKTTAQLLPGSTVNDNKSSLLVDYYQESPGVYEVLIVANEHDRATALFAVDPRQNEVWEWLSHSR
jgi:folate-binding protein YgfZ